MLCCAGEVVAVVVVDGNGVGRKVRVSVPAVGEKRSQRRTVPSATRGKDAMYMVPYQG
jgi:hypothetical protein